MKGLLSVSFGTSHAETRAKTIDAIDADLKAAFPDHAFYTAWTSGRIVEKVRAERGEEHDTIEEALERLSKDGVDDLVVAVSCLMQGYEMGKIATASHAWVDAAQGRTLRVARPLLALEEDRRAMARTVASEFQQIAAEDALVLMGHGISAATAKRGGSARDANAVYDQIQEELHALGRGNFFVGTVEGTPTFDDALAQLKARGAACVHLAPLMIVAGDHAVNDLAGDGDSWANLLREQGFVVNPILRGLGEYASVRQIVCAHAREAQPVER